MCDVTRITWNTGADNVERETRITWVLTRITCGQVHLPVDLLRGLRGAFHEGPRPRPPERPGVLAEDSAHAFHTHTQPRVYKECLKMIPHKHFTFAKIWVMAAHLEVRQKDLAAARKVPSPIDPRVPGVPSPSTP
eukprot:1544342-Rhodomonas_salina.2